MNITICSVSYESKEFLEENICLIDKLNKGQKYHWIIGENSPEQSGHRLPLNHPGFEVIKGLPRPQVDKAAGSYHHGLTMNLIRGKVDTRFVLFIDPDCYIVRKNWIQEIMNYMDSRDLAFFGVPWHPRWFNKYRYFPCVHCMFVDQNKVPLDQLDFSPGYYDSDVNLHSSVTRFEKVAGKGNSLRRRVLNKLLVKLQVPALEARKKIMSSPDVGARIEMKYRDYPDVKYECVQPVFSMYMLQQTSIPRNGIIERFLPERLCFAPKNHNYYSTKSFNDYGVFDAISLSWEEFIWKESPFCFHMRNNTRRDNSGYLEQINILKKSLKNLIQNNQNTGNYSDQGILK